MDSEEAGKSEQDKDDGDVVTMLDVLEEENELEEDANAVLGGSDDKNCTYIQGYIKRQALYSCLTCLSVNKEPAGICLACSYACHEGHDLCELYTKRNFCCDCGNSKFTNNKCALYPNKGPLNSKNLYNHNFSGNYCICERPYPDPEDDAPDEMIQCIMCEDWFHGRHLGGTMPENSDFSEMICKDCMKKHKFLRHYNELLKIEMATDQESFVSVDDSVVKEEKSLNVSTSSSLNCTSQSDCLEKSQSLDNGATPCKLEKFKEFDSSKDEGPTFWKEDWRTKLCQCKSCMHLYAENNCSFLVDKEDTVHAYEERGRRKIGEGTQYDKGMTALKSLDRVKQIEAIHGYNNMKTELVEYLQKFAENKKVVREEDIREFFETMKANKKFKKDCEVPEFCR